MAGKLEIEPENASIYFRLALIHAMTLRNDLNQRILSEMAGISQQFVSFIIRGKREGEEETRRKISKALGVQYEIMLEIGREFYLSGKGFDAVENDKSVDLFTKKAEEYRLAREKSTEVDLAPLARLLPDAIDCIKDAVKWAEKGEGGRSKVIGLIKAMLDDLEKYRPAEE